MFKPFNDVGSRQAWLLRPAPLQLVQKLMGKLVSYRAASWEDNSLVKIFGATLASELCPMAIILEYFPLGPLDAYLKFDFF